MKLKYELCYVLLRKCSQLLWKDSIVLPRFNALTTKKRVVFAYYACKLYENNKNHTDII